MLSGRALPYGESITYWPLAEMVKASADIADDDPIDVAIEKLRACCPAEAVADVLGLATGVLEAVHGERSQQEIAWAAREWAALMAGVQPLVLVFEDIHWAEEPLLELIEHLASWVREAPLLILCFARAELLDVRPEWGGGRVRATAIELEALGSAESEELVDALLETIQGPFDEGQRRILLEKTEGNPLFLEETVRMLAENGGGSAEQIPDTVQALIAARIDRLEPQTRTLLQRASVIGRSFWGGAIAHLSPEFEDVDCVLDDLLLRDFVVREQRSTISGESAYRFKHVLIREVAYGGLSKASRADHHLHFADWLSERAGDELLEIRAYHLDHASALLAELDGAPPAELAARAAEVLEEAGRRALAREAYRARAAPAAPLGRARPDARAPLAGRARRRADGGLERSSARDGGRARGGGRAGGAEDPGARADRAGRGRAVQRRERDPCRRADGRGPRGPRRGHASRHPLRGVHGTRVDLRLARPTRRVPALDGEGARGRPGSRAQGSRDGGGRVARRRPPLPARGEEGCASRQRVRWSSPTRAAASMRARMHSSRSRCCTGSETSSTRPKPPTARVSS